MNQRNLDRNSTYYLRFNLYHRLLHGLLITSFLGLAASGMPLRFNEANWAINLAHASGGFGAILFFHKFFAILLTLCFLLHLAYVVYRIFIRRDAGILWGPTSMIPQPKDLLDLYQHFRWFFGIGPRPRFGWFTYWEKFDYWAVFWGMAIIGGTGYVMWFSSNFARLFPGWLFNIALLIHADEALLAVWFIFAIHFFNSHLRPEKFPMDLVIFTGRESLEELHESRPVEYTRLEKNGGLVSLKSDPPPLWLRNYGRIIGFTAISIGFLLFALTLLSFVNE